MIARAFLSLTRDNVIKKSNYNESDLIYDFTGILRNELSHSVSHSIFIEQINIEHLLDRIHTHRHTHTEALKISTK